MQRGEKSGMVLASKDLPFYHIKMKTNISSMKGNIFPPIKNRKTTTIKSAANLELG